jgi:hypothetical protein
LFVSAFAELASGTQNQEVDVTFSEGMDTASLLNVINYSIAGYAITNLMLFTNNLGVGATNMVILQVNNPLTNSFTLDVSTNVENFSGAPVAANTAAAGTVDPLSSVDIGNYTTHGLTFDNGPGSYEINASGNDIWNAEDGFRFVYETRTNNFAIAVQVSSINPANTWSKAGLMARVSIDPTAGTSRMIALYTTALSSQPALAGGDGENSLSMAVRDTTGNAAYQPGDYIGDGKIVPSYPNQWLLLTRQTDGVHDLFTVYAATNETNWTWMGEFNPVTIGARTPFPSVVNVGLCTTAHIAPPGTDLATATYQNFGDYVDHIYLTNSPQSVTVETGARATFSVLAGSDGTFLYKGATNTFLTYQWYTNGVAVSGGTSDSYTTPLATASLNGLQVYCAVTTIGGVTTNSPAATLTVASPPSIVSQPASLTITFGASAIFQITASGTAPLSYQWQFDEVNLSDNLTIAGSQSNVLSLASVPISEAGAYRVVVTNAYGAVTSMVATLAVMKATPVISWAPPAAITYGTALGSGQLNATANVPGVFAYIPPAGAVLTAGTDTLAVAFTPADTNDYQSVTDTVSVVVSPAFLTVTAANASRVYGQANPAFTGNIAGVTNGDNITATYTCSAASTSPVGTYAIVPSLVDPNFRRTNYLVMLNNGTLTVTQATPITTWTNPAPIIYGTALSSNQLNATASVPGSFAYTPTNGAALNTGTNTLSAIFTPSDSVDYGGATNTVSLVVSPAPLIVTAASASRAFGQANPPLTGTIIGLTNGDNITASYSCSATSNSSPGTYPILVTLVDLGDRQTNYTVNLLDGTLTVTQAGPLVIWTNPVSIAYGAPLGSNQLNAAANVPGVFAYNPINGAVLDTGTNTLSAIFTPNDTVDYSSATDTVSLVVSPAALTVTAADAGRPYGQPNPLFTGTIAGVTNGDNITAIYSCVATANSPAGAYPIVPSLVDPNDRETNYTVSLVNGTLTVTGGSPQISIQPTNQSVALGGSASFAVGAGGSAPLVYQWQLDGTNLSAATNTTVVLSPIVSSNAGNYDVVITNAYGSVTSVTATLSVLGVPVSFVTSSGGIQFSNGQLHLTLSGLTGQGSVLIETSTDLTQWTPIFTNPPGFGSVQFVDPATANFRYRYYRATTPGP